MCHPPHNPLWEAANLLPPLGVPGWDLTSLEHCRSGGILLSCRAPGYRGSWPCVAPPPEGDGLFPGWPHCGRLVVAFWHAGRAAMLKSIPPHYPVVRREVLVSLPASLIATGDVSQACLSGTHHLHWPRPGPPRTGHHPLRLSPWEQVHHRSGFLEPPQLLYWAHCS